jgi:hypothetical protein
MSKPVIESIVEDVLGVLRGVTVVSGYNQDLLPDRPNPTLGNRMQDGAAIVYLGERTAEDSRPQQYAQWEQIVSIVFNVIESDASDMPIDQRLNLIVSDAEKALMIDPKRSRWAIDTWSQSVRFEPTSAGATEGQAILDFVVQYRTNWGDPYTSPHRS